MNSHLMSRKVGLTSKESKGRAFTPPGAGENLKAKIQERMSCKAFCDVTGLSYEALRQWIGMPIIPFLLAEFVAFWLGVDLREMMKLGVRLTLQSRSYGNQITLKAPNEEILQDKRFQVLSELLSFRGCNVVHVSKEGATVPVPSIIRGDILKIYKVEKEKAGRLSAIFARLDRMKHRL